MFELITEGEGEGSGLTLLCKSAGKSRVAAVGRPLLEIASRSFKPFPGEELSVSTTWLEAGEGRFRVEHRLRALRGCLLGRGVVSLRVPGASIGKGYRFVPHLHPEPGMLAADQVFRSPCVILEGEQAAVGLVPDLSSLAELQRRGVRTGLTLEKDALSYGIVDHRVKGHVYFRGRPFPGFRLAEGEELVLAYHLFAGEAGGAELHRRINTFLWETWGKERYMDRGPQKLPLMEYGRLAADWAFLDDENWVDLELEGVECGGVYSFNMNSRFAIARRQRFLNWTFYLVPRLYPRILQLAAAHVTNHPPAYRVLRRVLGSSPATLPSIVQLQSWFNNVRSAYGALWLAGETGSQLLRERAEMVRDLALLAPRERGFTPAVLYLIGNRMLWKKGTRAFFHLNRYHLPDTCTTAYHLLEWYRDLDPQPAILDACRELADSLLEVQSPGGAFPAWLRLTRGGFRTDPCLSESAESAPSVMFLALMARLTRREEYLRAAVAGGGFLAREVLEKNLWYDYENFFSCSPKPVGWSDPRSGCFPECTMSMYWTAAAFLQLYLASGEPHFLDAGRRALDRLLAHHQVWSPPVFTLNAFGGFASQNTDAEWNDARQGCIAPLLVDYYHACGERELFERGVATLRACFATMLLDEELFLPLRPSVRGAIEENYAHFGYDAPTPGYLEPDWGAGSALYALARIVGEHGQIYVDLDAGHAFGIDGCVVRDLRREGDEVHLSIYSHLGEGRELKMRLRGADEPLRLVVNEIDLGAFPAEELARGITIPL